jgi:predicted AlkP superfamily phosphohydrolase/phosphomutase
MLWGKHDAELLEVYRAVDASIGEVMRREPDAELMVMSDHGFAAFDRAVNLNTFLISRGLQTKAYALGLNGLYLLDKNAEPEIRRGLLELRDPANGRNMIESVTQTNPSPQNRSIAPDFIVGYSAGYRASWQTALGEAPEGLVTDNDDAWIADHCIDPREVPAVLFTTREIRAKTPALKDLPISLLALYGVARPAQMTGQSIF